MEGTYAFFLLILTLITAFLCASYGKKGYSYRLCFLCCIKEIETLKEGLSDKAAI